MSINFKSFKIDNLQNKILLKRILIISAMKIDMDCFFKNFDDLSSSNFEFNNQILLVLNCDNQFDIKNFKVSIESSLIRFKHQYEYNYSIINNLENLNQLKSIQFQKNCIFYPLQLGKIGNFSLFVSNFVTHPTVFKDLKIELLVKTSEAKTEDLNNLIVFDHIIDGNEEDMIDFIGLFEKIKNQNTIDANVVIINKNLKDLLAMIMIAQFLIYDKNTMQLALAKCMDLIPAIKLSGKSQQQLNLLKDELNKK